MNNPPSTSGACPAMDPPNQSRLAIESRVATTEARAEQCYEPGGAADHDREQDERGDVEAAGAG